MMLKRAACDGGTLLLRRCAGPGGDKSRKAGEPGERDPQEQRQAQHKRKSDDKVRAAPGKVHACEALAARAIRSLTGDAQWMDLAIKSHANVDPEVNTDEGKSKADQRHTARWTVLVP